MTFPRLHTALLASCAMFALVGVTLALAGELVFGLWRDAVAEALWGGAFPESLREYAAFTDGVLGASIAGKWVACLWLVHEPIRRRERWGLAALLAAHLTWFAIDATASVMLGAWVNVWMIDLLPLVLVGGLAVALWPHTKATARPPGPIRASVRLLALVCLASIAIGVLCAFAIRSPIFHYYGAATAETFFGGATEGAWVDWQRFAYGLIGATIAGQFVALAVMLARAPHERWVLHAVASSMTVWFVLDTSLSALHGAWFNIVQVNLPSYLAAVIPWAFSYAASRAASGRRGS